MKKFFVILFLFCLTGPLLFSWMGNHYKRDRIKHDVKSMMIAGMDRSELVLLKFSFSEINSGLRWEHDKEFEYRSQMYDIVEKIIKVDSVYYWCWWDHEETALNKELDNLVAKTLGTDRENNSRQKRLVEFYKSICINAYCDEFKPSINPDKILSETNCGLYTSFQIPPPFPPPEL